MEEKYDEAIDVLSAFVDKFPSHPDRQDASDIVVSLEERSRFTPFKVGCVLPLSGPFGLFGRRALDGVEFAFSIISETAQDLPFQIIVKDSRSDPKIGANALEDLDQQKVGAILGPMSISDTVAEIAQKRGMPIIVFTQKEGVTDSGPYVFRNFITPQMQVQALVDFAVDELGVDRFAVLYPDEHYGRRYMNLFWDQVVDHGRVINGVETYNPEGTDFATPIKKLTGIYYTIPRDLVKKSMPHPIDLPLSSINDDPINGQSPHIDVDLLPVLSGIPLYHEFIDALGRRNVARDDQWHPIVDFDAIFIPDAPKKAGLVIPQLAYYDIRDVYLLGTNLWNSQTLLDMSKDYMKSTLIVDGFFAKSQNPHTKAFVDDFKRVYNRMPGIIEAVAYDSTMMVFQTMRQTASDLRRDIKQALSQISDFNGVSGRTSFTANGEAQKSMTMLRIQKGRFVEAKVESSAAGDISQH
jgi:ABC-type branched-subunit amino acid transport system substrate-binding protein